MRRELYRFSETMNIPAFVQDGSVVTQTELIWNVTSSDYQVEYLNEIYYPDTIGRSDIELKTEVDKASVEISVSIDNEFGRRWLENIIDNNIRLTIYQQDDSGTKIIWKGRLSSLKPDESEINMIFESIFTSLRRPGLRLRYQRNCPHTLYDRGCKLDHQNFKVNGTISAISGSSVTCTEASTYPDGYFTSGILADSSGNMRFILSHAGSELVLSRPFITLIEEFTTPGYGVVEIALYPGCDRSKETCGSKFGNILNFGGYPFIPLKNPFTGSSII